MIIVMLCATCYHLGSLKNVKNIYGGVLHLVKLQAKAYKLKPTTLLKVALLRAFFSRLSNYVNGSELRKASNII